MVLRRFLGVRRSEEPDRPRRCLLLVAEGQADPTPDDALVVDPLFRMGWEVACVSWRAQVDWSAYDAVVIRSTWDYHLHEDAFLAAMRHIDATGARLINPLGLVEWNVRKTYLRELEGQGVPIVPTIWRDHLAPGDLVGLLAEVGGEDMVVKPVVGATANDTYRISRNTVGPISRQVETTYEDRPLLAQPLVTSVLEHGEYSLFYFGGTYSHAVHKRARPGDFRVQSEYGGKAEGFEPDAGLRGFADRVMAALPIPAVYARIDAVRSDTSEGYQLMELELIEPELFLRVHPDAPARLAEAIAAGVDA